MTITRQQIDAWDDAVDAAYEAGRQEGMKQERALWTLTKLGQEIEEQPKRQWVGLTEDDVNNALYKYHGWREFAAELERLLKEKNYG